MTKRPFIHLFIRFFFLSLFLSGTLNEEFSSLSSPWVPRRAMTSLTTGKQLEGINAAPSPPPHPPPQLSASRSNGNWHVFELESRGKFGMNIDWVYEK